MSQCIRSYTQPENGTFDAKKLPSFSLNKSPFNRHLIVYALGEEGGGLKKSAFCTLVKMVGIVTLPLR